MLEQAIHSLAFASGRPTVSACIRQTPEDFQVNEIPLLEPDGAGEHVWLLIRKRLENTAQVASLLAKFSGVPLRDVSYAGMKDRQAVTEQWFSVQLPGQDDPDWMALNSESITVIRHARHSRKLRRGALKGNTFRLVLRELEGDPAALDKRLAHISNAGVPNYFGEQRFGRDGSNLHTALQLFKNPKRRMTWTKRGLALSAARSFLFNQVLSHRVAAGNWNQVIAGDALQLQGSHSFFIAETLEPELVTRIEQQDVHPTGPLYGRGECGVLADCLQLETEILAGYPEWLAGLKALGLKQARRALRVPVEGLEWRWTGADELELVFSLSAGAYATSVLREMVVVKDVAG
ncbi:MAG: tRNA pseudouridine(13) synthase TruD [Gammaproteobacteria bacterium]|nr:MAG: tRNA pseudouridine(13) synthase TruD [Gammaproteobacteria bacterium]